MVVRVAMVAALAWVFVGNGGSALAGDFPEEIDRLAAENTASYRCLAECTLRYIDTRTGATGTRRIEVGPATVTVGSPSEDAIHAAAHVALSPSCPGKCQDELPAGKRELSCRLSGTGPCSRVR